MFKRTNGRLMLSDGFYALGKKMVQVIIPALSSLYFGLGSIWGLPSTEKVVGTLAVLATFLGVSLGVSSKQYDSSGAAYKGRLLVTNTEEGVKRYTLEVDGDPHDIENEEKIAFKVEQGVV